MFCKKEADSVSHRPEVFSQVPFSRLVRLHSLLLELFLDPSSCCDIESPFCLFENVFLSPSLSLEVHLGKHPVRAALYSWTRSSATQRGFVLRVFLIFTGQLGDQLWTDTSQRKTKSCVWLPVTTAWKHNPPQPQYMDFRLFLWERLSPLWLASSHRPLFHSLGYLSDVLLSPL